MTTALSSAAAALKNNPQCDSFFGQSANGTTASEVLAGLANGFNGTGPGSYGWIGFYFGPPAKGLYTVAQTRATQYSGTSGNYPQFTIKINLFANPNSFQNESGTDQAATILHELGHALAILGFTGGQFIDNDTDLSVNAKNTTNILKDCFNQP